MKLVVFFGILLVVAVFAAILFPVFAHARIGNGRVNVCFSNVKALSLGMILYGDDFDERYPQRDCWIDSTGPYLKNDALYHCPWLKASRWGYAFNATLSGSNLAGNPARVPLVYDSINPIKNASDLVTSLPPLPRHKVNFLSYADGHAKSLAKGVKP